ILLRRASRSDEGVLLAYGSMYFGWVLYVQGAHLVYELSNIPFGLRIVSDRELPPGEVEVRYELEMRERPFAGTGRLFIGTDMVAEFVLPSFAFGVAYQGLELGRNGACPVSRRYEAPFPFMGEIVRATLNYDVAPYTQDEMAIISARSRFRL
ncbi:MAG: hypothetical protein ACXWUX_10945, partial [Allosphingosinicella sp.]